MNYSDQTCKFCGNKFIDGDDIVVCPECATPHHRECWKSCGECVNSALHGTDFVWEKERYTPPAEENTDEPTAHQTPAPDSAVCHICGSENPADSLHCGSCGALLGSESEEQPEKITCHFCGKENPGNVFRCSECGAPLALSQNIDDNPYLHGTGIDGSEIIGKTKADDLARYVQGKSRSYLPKFKKLASGKKLSFNWAAFFLAPYWFFYRKLYKAGIFFAVFFVSVSMLTFGIQEKVFTAAEEYYDAIGSVQYSDASQLTDDDFAALEKASDEFVRKAAPYEAILLAVSLAERLLCALVADRLFYKKATEDIAEVHSSTDSESFRKLMIMRRGSTSLVALMACVFGMQVLTEALIYTANLFI